MKEGILLVISGPSGAGKGTVCRALCQEEENIVCSISVTTRPPRAGELDGLNYFFVTEENVKKMIVDGELLEWARVYENYYGTPYKFVLKYLKEGKDVLLEIDTQGALQIKKKMPEGVLIYLIPPSLEELRFRLVGRGTDFPEDIEKRLQCVGLELESISQYDYVVFNDQVDKAVKRIKAIVIAEKCRAWRQDVKKFLI